MIAQLLAGAEYPRLKARLGTLGVLEIASEWRALAPLQKLAVFKLLAPEKARILFEALSDEDRYLVFCGVQPGSIAPLTEGLSPAQRALFETLEPGDYGEMLRQLLS